MKIVLPIIIIVAAVIGGIFLVSSKEDPSERQAESEQASGIFELTFEDYEGNIVSLADFKGKPLVVNAWAAWCPFCVNELPDFATLQKEFKDDIVVIAVDRNESHEQTKSYSDNRNLSQGFDSCGIVDEDGNVIGVFDNGQSQLLGKLVMIDGLTVINIPFGRPLPLPVHGDIFVLQN